jgi:CubicO group peptidase (beta-lactamase class C family)
MWGIAMNRIKHHIRHIALILLTLAICLTGTPAGARVPVMALESPQSVPDADLVGTQALAAFLDDLLVRQLAENHIPGASVAVVKDGKLLFANGYGYANIEKYTRVAADRALFRVGSVAKLFTWTAVMQLVEQGKLDLDADVNSYLSAFQIPATYPQPITPAHLMTHTAGFEDRQLGITVASADALLPLGSYLAGAMPARIYPPGTVTAYSNYGTALAGYIVEIVSGEPFAQYVERHILAPLGMRRSTFAQPLPSELAEELAVSYRYDDTYHAVPFEYFQIAPAVSLSATATDMAQFMLAHLQDGRLGEARVLEAETAQDMHRRHFTNDPHVNGMTYGFAEMTLNGQRLLIHSGTTNDELFRSLLMLVPEQNLGLFVSYSGAGGGEAKWALAQAVLDLYFPAARPNLVAPPADFVRRSDRYVGSYQSTRINATTIEKIGALLAPEITVGATDDGYLSIAGLSKEPTRWVETAPLIFRQVGGEDIVVFRADDEGRITHMFQNNLPIAGFRKLAWYESLPLHYAILAGCVVLFLIYAGACARRLAHEAPERCAAATPGRSGAPARLGDERALSALPGAVRPQPGRPVTTPIAAAGGLTGACPGSYGVELRHGGLCAACVEKRHLEHRRAGALQCAGAGGADLRLVLKRVESARFPIVNSSIAVCLR